MKSILKFIINSENLRDRKCQNYSQRLSVLYFMVFHTLGWILSPTNCPQFSFWNEWYSQTVEIFSSGVLGFFVSVRVIISLTARIYALLIAHYPNYINFVMGFFRGFPITSFITTILIWDKNYLRSLLAQFNISEMGIDKFMLKPLNMTMHLRHLIF